MLYNGSFGYRNLYESIHAVATSKESSDRDITFLILKPSLTLNKYQSYRAGIDINHLMLEKKILTVWQSTFLTKILNLSNGH